MFAFADAGHATLDAGEPVTGDAANITAYTAADNAALGASNDVNPTEIDATNAKGYYEFDPTQAETNGDVVEWYAQSSTAGVQVVVVGGSIINTRPPNFADLGIEADGVLTKVNTLNGHTAQTGDAYAYLGTNLGAAGAAATEAGGTGDQFTGIAAVGSVTGAVGSVTGNVVLDATQPNYAPAKAGDAMTLATDAVNAAALATDATTEIGTAFLATSLTKGIAGTIERAFWQILKAQATVDGAVAGTPTSSAFDTDLTAADGTYDHQLILFTSGSLAGEARPIGTYVQTNGRFTLQEALTAAPAATDEFVILPNHIHPVADIQSGLATSAEIAALNDLAVTDILSDGIALNTTSGVLDVVNLVNTTTTNTDMRGTDSAYTGTPPSASAISSQVASDLATAHGAGSWATATGFSTFDASTDTVTLANGAHGGASATITLSDYSDFQGAAGDPWSTALPGAYGVGTAGYILGTNLDAAVSSAGGDDAATIWSYGTRVLTAAANITSDGAAIGATAGVIDHVTLVDTTTTNTDMRGTDSAYTGTPPTEAAIADAVWDEATSGHQAAGSTGLALTSASSAGDPWSTSLPGAYAAGTAGYIMGTYLDSAISDLPTDVTTSILTTSVETVEDTAETDSLAALLLLSFRSTINLSGTTLTVLKLSDGTTFTEFDVTVDTNGELTSIRPST